MKVLLYNVGRNLNRAYRTCEAFGIQRLQLLDCNARLSGNLYKAAERIHIETLSEWPSPPGLLALEIDYAIPLWNLKKGQWVNVDTIVIGGETGGLPTGLVAQYKVTIPMQGQISSLTVEAALAIALYAWKRNESF